MTYANIYAGVLIYFFMLFLLLILSAVRYPQHEHAIGAALGTVPLLRIMAVSIPFSNISEAYRIIIVSIPFVIAVFIAFKLNGLELRTAGFNLDKWRRQVLIALLGLPIGLLEYFAVKSVLTEVPKTEILLWIFVFIFCVGFIEELLFRGILFNIFAEALGNKRSMYIVSALYASLTISQMSVFNTVLAFLISLIFCRLYTLQKSIYGLILAHGLINITLYIICPFAF
jgi:membrane protease YdiL (CAAX protease family)